MRSKFESTSLFICVAVGIWSVWLHFASPLDNQWQKLFFIDGHWLVDENEPILKWILYRGPKIISVVLGFGASVLLCLTYLKKLKLSPERHAGLVTFLITIIFYPTLIGLLKDLIRQPCPRDTIMFGGQYAGTLWMYFLNRGDIRCFPGAHASAPFSLLALAYLFEDKANRLLFLFTVLPMAFFIGFYQVAKGAHFVSDTIFTAAFAWVFISCVNKVVLRLKAKTNKNFAVEAI